MEETKQRSREGHLDRESLRRFRWLRIRGGRGKTPEARFWSRVKVGRDEVVCWPWLGPKYWDGYGRARIGKKTSKRAHRLAWELQRGAIPDRICVLHHCDNPICVNPDHLFLGSNNDNVKDRDAKGRAVVPIRRAGKWTGGFKKLGG